MKHDVFADRAGWGNYPRLTCLVCNETALKKLYMTSEQWEKVVAEFMAKHASNTASTRQGVGSALSSNNPEVTPCG